MEQNQNNRIIIRNVNIIPMTTQTVLRHQSILIEAGLIQWIGEGEQLPGTQGEKEALIIDAEDGYALPGLIDMHIHIQACDEFLLYLANGVTTVRNMAGTPDNLNRRQQIAAGEVTGPAVFTCGPILEGRNPVFPHSTLVNSKARARGIIQKLKAMEFDFIKVYDTLAPHIYEEILHLAADAGMPVIGHVPTEVGLERVLELKGQLSVEHLHGFASLVQLEDSPVAGKCELLSVWPGEAYAHVDESKIEKAAARIMASGIWNCPTIEVMKKLVPVEVARGWLKQKEAEYFDPMLKEVLWWKPERTRKFDRDFFLRVEEMVNYHQQFTRALYLAGAKLIPGTDAPNPFVMPGFSFSAELKNFHALGMTPYEVLKTATVDAAACLGQSGLIGSLSVGKTADLILLQKNPLENLEHLEAKQGIVVKGQWYTMTELNNLLEGRARYYRSEDYSRERKTIELIDEEAGAAAISEALQAFLRNFKSTDINRLDNLSDRLALLLYENRLDLAIALTGQLLSCYPDSYYSYVIQGDAWLRAGDLHKARQNYEKSLECYPGNILATKRLRAENPLIYIEDIA